MESSAPGQIGPECWLHPWGGNVFGHVGVTVAKCQSGRAAELQTGNVAIQLRGNVAMWQCGNAAESANESHVCSSSIGHSCGVEALIEN